MKNSKFFSDLLLQLGITAFDLNRRRGYHYGYGKYFYLEVGKRNVSVIALYEKIGFHKIIEYEYSTAYGIILLN